MANQAGEQVAMKASYWQREAGWRFRFRDEPIPSLVDFAVIGAGISGLATAIELRERNRGATIAVLEAERVGYGASGRNAGFLSPIAAPVWLLGAERRDDWRWASKHLHDVVSELPALINARAPEAELGAARLRIAARGAIPLAGLREFSRMLSAAALRHELLEGKRGGERFVSMAAHVVHPYRLVLGLAEHAAGLGITIHEKARVQRILTTARGAQLALESGRNCEARRVVACTNAYTGALDVGRRLIAVPTHSFMLASVPLAEAVSGCSDPDAFTVEVNTAESYHRMHRGRRLVGGCDRLRPPRGGDFAVPARVRATLHRLLSESEPDRRSVAVDHAWSGKLHTTPTGMPIIERSRRHPAVIVNVGYGGTGVALSLALASAVAALVSDQRAGGATDDLMSIAAATRPPVLGAARAAARIAMRLATPWRR